MSTFASAAFDVPLVDLGAADPAFAGILCPEPELGREKIGISDQFLANAEVYHEKYSNSPHWTGLLQKAIGLAAAPVAPGSLILDVGTGSGVNTIFPLRSLVPGCRIVATDLSPDLLAILRRKVTADGISDGVACICVDAMSDHFRPEVFDIVVGGAILHHLLDPQRALAAAYRALRPGGLAMFFEPGEGAAILRIAYDLILERAGRDGLELHPDARRVLAAMSLDYATRTGRDKSAPHFRHMDDKWLFTRSWLTEAARDCGFEPPLIEPGLETERIFERYTEVTLRLAAGLARDVLPGWAWSIIERFDNSFSADMKRELVPEIIVVLRKPGRAEMHGTCRSAA